MVLNDETWRIAPRHNYGLVSIMNFYLSIFKEYFWRNKKFFMIEKVKVNLELLVHLQLSGTGMPRNML